MSYTEYTVPQMKTMAIKYAERILDEANQTGSSVKLKDEFIMLKLDKSILETMLNDTDTESLLAIFAIDSSGADKQSVILVPCDKNNNAVKYNSNTEIKGTEAWMKVGRKMDDIIYPNGGSTPDISTGINNVFNDVNM